MIKPQEIRIGNLIYVNNELKTITAIGFEAITSNNTFPYKYHKYIELEPIPLTKWWLLKLGAKKQIDLYWLSLLNLNAEFHFEICKYEIVTTIKGLSCDLILNEIKYVHQLQNIFYALTGEELTYSEIPNN